MSEPNTPPEKTAEELQAEIAKLQADKTALVGETTELRKSRQEKDEEIKVLQDAVKAATEKNAANPEEQKIADVVQKILGNESQKSAERNREAAFTKFVTDNNEYHPDNDTGGLKLAALKREYAGFNTSGLVETDDFVNVIGKAHALLRGPDTPRQTTETPYSSTTSTPVAPAAPQNDKLSDQEKKVMEQNGWTETQFTTLKAKYPDMVAELIAPVVH